MYVYCSTSSTGKVETMYSCTICMKKKNLKRGREIEDKNSKTIGNWRKIWDVPINWVPRELQLRHTLAAKLDTKIWRAWSLIARQNLQGDWERERPGN